MSIFNLTKSKRLLVSNFKFHFLPLSSCLNLERCLIRTVSSLYYKLQFSKYCVYLQILRLFSESTESIGVLKVDLAEAKKHLSARNKQLHQLWYRSVTLRHIISLLDQIEDIAKVRFFSLDSA
jgi:hypothetical protein